MFSPDEFYHFLKLNYGWDKSHSSVWIPRTHGSKNLLDWFHMHPNAEPSDDGFRDISHLTSNGVIILHDQEPFSKTSVDIYRQVFWHQKKEPMYQNITDEQIMMRSWATPSWPIWCHSQKQSRDIEWLESIGFIPCHYFYHGFIAKDWYRFYKYHPDLEWRPAAQFRFLLYARDTTGGREYRKTVIDRFSKSKNVLYHQDLQVSSDHSAKIDIDDQNSSSVQIVCETVFDNPSCTHLTEKVLKSMVMNQPFVGFFGPKSLSYLRSYGFQTFHNIWDESYDDIVDHNDRLDKVCSLIDSLEKLDDRQWADILEKCRPIVEHNRRHFYSEQFETTLLDEMHANMSLALKEQKHRLITDSGGSLYKVVDQLISQCDSLTDNTVKRVSAMSQYLRNTQPDRWKHICQQYPWAEKLFL